MDPKEAVSKTLTKALTLQEPLARSNFERLRRVHPDDSPEQLVKRVSTFYLRAVAGSGGAAGMFGVLPGAAIPAAGVDAIAFTEASVLYALVLAEIHGIHTEDIERRKLLVQTILIGDAAVNALNKGAARAVPHWGRQIVIAIPIEAVRKANKILGPSFITKFGTKQGVLALSKQVPLGLGILFGASASYVVGRLTVRTASRVFGPPSTSFDAPPTSILVDAAFDVSAMEDPVESR